MSKTAIVKSGERFFIKQLSESQPIKLDRVIFANISGVNSNTEIDINGTMPDVAQIVHTAPVTQSGLLNDRTVVYSVILDTNVGDFSFNYIGLVNAETNTLCMVMHTDLTKKIKTAGQRQGNTITESIWLEMDNASESTGITVNAKTWQIDYSKRLAGEDERIRLTNYDLYNRIAINDGLDITKQNNQLIVSPGIVYIAGLRVELLKVININVENNQSLYVDAWLAGTITGEWAVKFNLIAGANLHDYHDGNFQHYVERIASIDNNGNLIKVNPKSFVTTFDLASLTKTGIVKLNSAVNSTSETEAATPRAVKSVYDLASGAVRKSGDTMTGELYINGQPVLTKRSYGIGVSHVLGDESIDETKNQYSGFLFSQQQSSGVKPFNYSHVIRSAINDSFADIAIDILSKRAKFRGVLTDEKNSSYTGDYSWTEFLTTKNISNYVPVGIPLPWPTTTPPDGWLKCNGWKFDKNKYPKLAMAYPTGYLPELRGEFIRGWDDGRGVDPSRDILSRQGDAIRNIVGSTGYLTFGGVSAVGGAFHEERLAGNGNGVDGYYYARNLFFDASRVVPTAHENRPRSVAFMYIVKAE